MHNRRYVAPTVALAAACVTCAGAKADVFLADDFENQSIPLTTPQVGYAYNLAGTTGSPFSIATSPALGTQSLKLIREGVDNPTINAQTNDGLMVDGAVIEYSWSNYIEHVHRFNAPVQIQLGMVNGLAGRLVFMGVNDPGNGSYFYTDQSGNMIATGVQPSLNAWDRVRAVLRLDFFDAGGPNFMTGNFDMFISVNGGAEQQVANNVPLAFGEIPSDDPMTPDWDESTAGLMKIQKGPFSGATYYDNISISTVGPGTPPANWNVDSSGNWSVGSNWSTGVAPNGVSATANFGTIISAGRTVTVDSPHTVGTLNFASPISYTVAGGATLTLDSGGSPVINSAEGSHSVSAPVVLAKDTIATIAPGSTLGLTGGVNGATAALTKGGSGQLNLGRTQVATLTVNSGTVRQVPNGTSAGRVDVTALSVDSSAKLDVTNNAIVVDYTTTDPSASIRAALASAYTGGTWSGNGITSSTAATTPGHSVGFARSADVAAAPIFSSPDGTAVLIRYTRIGDANLDGTTNIGDFSLLAANFNTAVNDWSKGDFNYDGSCNIGDFSLLAANFNQTIAADSPREAVPEPAGLAALALGGLLVRRCRQR